jgi:hypothetical protein
LCAHAGSSSSAAISFCFMEAPKAFALELH